MRNRFKIYHPIRFAISVAIVLFAIFLAFLANYRYQENNNNKITSFANKSLSELSKLSYNSLIAELEHHNSELSVIANSFDSIVDDYERKLFLIKQSNLSKDGKFGITDSKGQLWVTSSKDTVDLSEEDCYQKGLDGQSSVDVLTMSIEGHKKRYIVFCKPISSKGSTIPDSIICELLDPAILINSLNINTKNFQLLLCDSDNSILAYTDYNNNSFAGSKPLYQLVSDMHIESDLIPVNSDGSESVMMYNNNSNFQYIRKTTDMFNNWIMYTSINSTTLNANAHLFSIDQFLISALIIAIVLTAILAYLLPVIKERNHKKVSDSRNLMLANMSHELRTPLNTILGICDILSRSKMTDAQYQEVMYVKDAGKNLLVMINDILDYSKLQSSKFELTTEEYDLESIIYDVTTVATIRLDEKPVNYMVYIAPYVPRYFIGDLARVRQIVNNIVSNAVKYTQEGSIILTVDCEFVTDTDIKLIFKVKDNGIGIKKENIPALFDNYTRFDAEKNKHIEGTGLGMAIANRFAALMDGTITVESEYGVGSEFTITLHQKASEQNDTLLPKHSSDGSYTKILILEKSVAMRNYYTVCLEDLEIEYEITDDNYKFSTLISENNYDYILADTDTIRMLSQELDYEDAPVFISLVHNNSGMIENNNPLFIPLFSLQLCSYLSGNKRSLRQPFDNSSLIIYPMPEKRILVVDDNSMNLQVATGIMEAYKMQIDTASSGKQSIEMATRKQYDLIFMDHMMPETDGEMAMQEIRKIKTYNYSDVPIIALTANATTGAGKMYTSMGFDDFLPKPIEIPNLHQIIYRWLEPENDNEEDAIEYSPEAPDTDVINEENEYIDFKEGLVRIGSMPIFLKTLRNFCDTIPKKHKILEKSFPDDMPTFVIEVHGLKGIAAIISANDLANQSLELEMMGKNEDIKGIEPLLPDYYDYMQQVKLCAERFIENHG